MAGTYYCPHHPDFTGPCACRKPAAGMFERAIRELGLDATRSWLVGDRMRDLEAAAALGARAVLVRTGYGRGEEIAVEEGVIVVDDLRAAASRIAGDDSGPGCGPHGPSA